MLSSTVFLWLVFDVTGRASAISQVVVCAALPGTLLSLHIGSIIDRHERRNTLIGADLVNLLLQSLFVVGMIFYPTPPLWSLCLIAFAMKTGAAFSTIAVSAILPRLVPAERFLEASALWSATSTILPVVAAAVIAFVLEAAFRIDRHLAYIVVFSFNGVTFLVSAVLLLRLPLLHQGDRPRERGLAWSSVREGLAFLPGHPFVFQTVALLGAVFLLNFFLNAPMVVVVVERFRGTPVLFAWLLATRGAGALLGAALARRGPPNHPGRRFAGCFILLAAAMLPLAFTRSVLVFSVMNAVGGALMLLALVPINAALQLAIPDELRGRVNGLSEVLGNLCGIAGALASGWVIEGLGLDKAFCALSVGYLLIGLAAIASPAFRRYR